MTESEELSRDGKRYAPVIPHTDEQRAADELGVPQENRDYPVVQDFMGIIARVENLEHDAAVLAGSPDLLIAKTRELFGSGDMKLSLQTRYAVTHYLARAAEWVMKEGMGDAVDNEDYVLERITLALDKLGYEVHISQKPGQPFQLPSAYRDVDAPDDEQE